MATALLNVIQKTIYECVKNNTALLVGFSGGVDSTVLLHALVYLKKHVLPSLEISAIYIHHGLSDNADSWAKHCQKLCEQWQVPLIIEKVSIDNQGNIEEKARNARYQAIYKNLQKDQMLCTAQHLDDQCETFFLALKRGSGPTGLSSMPQRKDQLLRPLLTISRQQIEHYASINQLVWIEDESNADQHYDRNFLRLSILPKLNHRWPHFSQMVARSAELCQQQEQLIEELLLPDFTDALVENTQLRLDPLIDSSTYKRNAMLRMWFKLHHLSMPTRKQLDLIWQTVGQAKEDANPQFLLHGKQIRRYQNRLYLLPIFSSIEHQMLDWNLSYPLQLPDNLGCLSLDDKSDKICRMPSQDEHVTVRFCAQGQFKIVGRNGSRAIKKLWQEFSVPPWLRTRIPLIYYNETLIAAVGTFVTEQGQGDQLNFVILPSSV